MEEVNPSESRPMPPWAEQFFEARLAEQPKTVQQAAIAAGVTRSAAFKAKRECVEFAERWAEADDELTHRLEASMLDRAINGVRVPILDKDGNQIGERFEHNAAREIFMLRNRDPERYNHAVGQAQVGDTLPSAPNFEIVVRPPIQAAEARDGRDGED